MDLDQRSKLQKVLEDITKNVYFQPPSSKTLTYPCIIYSLSSDRPLYAGNKIYLNKDRYTVIVIDRNPETSLFGEVRSLPLCSFDRFYTTGNLNHYAFSLYF